MKEAPYLLEPVWIKLPSVHSVLTTRLGGVSKAPFETLNLANHVGDLYADVECNRKQLQIHLPNPPLWLNQVHGTLVSTPLLRQLSNALPLTADAAVTNIPGEVLAILTADCLPVLFASKDGQAVGAAHAGWRGLCHGVLENTVAAILALVPQLVASDISVWLGPAIGPTQFEVGEDVLDAFRKQAQPFPASAFLPIPNKPGKYLANLYLLAKSRLSALGIQQVAGGDLCTFSDANQFFSYRRDGETGRFASLIWFS
jgi:YfiH family protein